MPPADTIRRRAQVGRRRNTVLLVAAAFALVVGGGFVVTDGDALETSAALPHREKIGSEGPDLVLQAQKIGTDDLLSMSQVKRLDPDGAWKVVGTDDDTQSTTPYATCPTKRFADKDPLRAFVRTYEVPGKSDERVAQAIEVSRSADQAEEAYVRLVRWYSDCEHPRVQLVGSYVVQRPFGDFRILRLRSHRSPERTFTVGFSHSGTVTSTLVHEVDGAEGPDIEDFARTLNDSVAKVCKDSGGRCTDDIEVAGTDPPRTSEAPAFLGIVDLPPIADIDQVWAGVKPGPAKVNPAATQCDCGELQGEVGAVDAVAHLRHPGGERPAAGVRRGRDRRPLRVRGRRQGLRQGGREANRQVPRRPTCRPRSTRGSRSSPAPTAARPGGSASRSTRSHASTTAWRSCATAPTSRR